MVLLSHDPVSGRISLRHFTISLAPSGLSKGAKALLSRRLPEGLGQLQDASELLTKGGYASVSTRGGQGEGASCVLGVGGERGGGGSGTRCVMFHD